MKGTPKSKKALTKEVVFLPLPIEIVALATALCVQKVASLFLFKPCDDAPKM